MDGSPQKHIVQVGESLYLIAKNYGLTVAELKQLNPLASSNLRVGQELIVGKGKGEVTAPPENNIHIVKSGETLYSIARQYGITTLQLIKLNSLISNVLKIGQILKVKEDPEDIVPKDIPEFYFVQKGDSLFNIAKMFGLQVANLMDMNQLKSGALSIGQKIRLVAPLKEPQNAEQEPTTVHTAPEEYQLHIVEKGESLYTLARKFGISIVEIKELNNLKSDMIRIGQGLKIPKQPIDNQNNTNIEIIEEPNKMTQEIIEEKPLEPEKVEINLPNVIVSNDPFYAVDVAQLPGQIKAIIAARKIFKLEAENGVDLFSPGLRGPVGRNHVNRPEDLEKVQARLVALKMLDGQHHESPEEIRKKHGGGAITANYIPRTIEAIERFQNAYNVRFWIEHSHRVTMMQTNSFTPGVVVPNDITFKFLKEYTQYKLVFPHPQNEQDLIVSFDNFPRSNFTKNYQGVSYIGSSRPEIPLSVFSRLGLNENLANALKFVSRNEGNFDAINSYDEGIFSYGFIQFAGNGGGLAPLLATIKHKAPKLYEDFFQKFGIDVDFSLENGLLKNTRIVVINPYDKGGKYIVYGKEAEQVLSLDKQLYGVFIRAGHHLPIITLQIDSAIQNFVKPALGIRLHLLIGTLNINEVLITDLISSPMGLALLVDLTVNRWTIQTRDIFRDAIEKVAIREKYQTEAEIRTIDEKKVLEQILADAQFKRDELLIKRVGLVLRSGLSSMKIKIK
jgi:peptidoglycan endopeptidase LytF